MARTDNLEPAMYVPGPYSADRPRELVEAYPFALLVSATAEGPFATSVPIYFETDYPDDNRLIGHLARSNRHAAMLRSGDPALVIFSGPNAYISASWYRERPTVPTWNYLSAQARGIIETVDDDEGQLAIMRRVAERVERGNPDPWSMEQAPTGRVAALLPHIRSFRLPIERLDAATKLSQTHPPSDRVRVVDALEQRGGTDDIEIARLMRGLDGA